MPLLNSTKRGQIAAKINEDISVIHEPTAVLRADILAAVNAADQWAEDNAALYNVALPTAFRNNATASMKARLLMEVIYKRFIG